MTTVTKMKHKFIKIGELERRQTKAKQEASQKLLLTCFASWKMTAAKSAKDEAQRVAAEVARIEAVKETAAAKKATLIGTFSMLRGSWAVRAKGQLEEVGGVLEAVKKLQRARRSQASSGGVELCAASSARCIAPRAVVSSAY